MSTNDGFGNQRVPEPGMSTATKILIGLGIGGGVFTLLCCGGLYFLGQKAMEIIADAMTDDPVRIYAITREIAEIEIPDQFEPLAGANLIFMKMAIYKGAHENSSLMLAELSQDFGGDQEELRQEINDAASQKGQQHQQLKHRKAKSREFTVKGKTVKFEFAQGEGDDSVVYHQVSGDFPGKGGRPAFLRLQVPAEDYDEQAILKMIESIR